MKKTILATIAIWGLGIGSAAALVNTLAKPPVPKVVEAAPKPVEAPEPAPIDLSKFKVPGPSIASAPIKAVRAQLRQKKAVPKKDMKCTGFRSMQFGPIDHGVRYCK